VDSAHVPGAEPTTAERASWATILWRALQRFYDQEMVQHAAALTYYTMLALFPAFLVAVALLGIFGREETVNDITGYLADQGASRAILAPVRSLLRSALDAGSGTHSATLVLAVVLSLVGASGAFASARRALNVVFGVAEGRHIVHRKAADVGATLLLILLATAILVLLFLGGGVADDLFRALGLGGGADTWNVVRWPAALGVTLLAYWFVYAAAPDLPVGDYRSFAPGALIAVPLWLGVSFAFWWYITNLSNLAAYGTFGAAIVLLIWLWLSNAALLLGAELNAAATLARGNGA
jgi:membrane protein